MLLGKIVVLRGRELTIDLIVFDISDINVILGINFLSKYGAKINYEKKKVQLYLDDCDKFTLESVTS